MKLQEANDNWNYWKFQLYWNKLKWVEPSNQQCNNIYFCTSTFKYYIKYGNKSFRLVVHSKLKPIEYDALSKRK